MGAILLLFHTVYKVYSSNERLLPFFTKNGGEYNIFFMSGIDSTIINVKASEVMRQLLEVSDSEYYYIGITLKNAACLGTEYVSVTD